jgi:DNA-binding MarR family transcriptional regulator
VSSTCDDPRITAFGMLIEAHAAIAGAVGRDLEEAGGMPVAWFEVLIRLARTPGDRLRMSELAGQVALSTSGLTRLVDRVEAAGLIARETCPSDRRGAYAVLTDAGRDALAKVMPAHVESLERRLVDAVGQEGLVQLTEHLRAIRDANRRPGVTFASCPGVD